MNQFFITGTDTSVGKTIISAILTLVLNAHYWKPIQSGIIEGLSEQNIVQQLTKLPDEYFFDSVYSLQAALSPDQAAALEQITIDLHRCILPHREKPLIVEGAGGVWVPLNNTQCMMDLIYQLQLPVIIVARGTLGTINHTVLTIEALRKRNIAIAGVVFNGELQSRNQQAIEKWGQVKTLFHVPHFNQIDAITLQQWVKQSLVRITAF
jgi:malonyl-CoA O-methyltransferase